MVSAIQRLCVVLFFSILSASMFAQEKTQYYYNTHENEILPDANASFQKGDYEHAIELCKWHYVIVGNHAADNLRNKAERCASLKEEMESLRTAGKIKEARDIAKTILSINPSDALAKEVSLIPDPIKSDIPSLSKLIPKLAQDLSVDTLAKTIPAEPSSLPLKDNDVFSNKNDSENHADNTTRAIRGVSAPQKMSVVTNRKYSYKNRVVPKIGVSVFNLNDISHTISPGGSIGIYDIGGSRSGVEASFYDWNYSTFYLAYREENSLLIGLSYVLRLTSSKCPIYTKADVSVFDFDAITLGCGATFFLGNHLCLELCARIGDISKKYYYKSGNSMKSGDLSNVLVHPSISIGWAF